MGRLISMRRGGVPPHIIAKMTGIPLDQVIARLKDPAQDPDDAVAAVPVIPDPARITTASLAVGATHQAVLAYAPVRITGVTTSVPARVRVYQTAAYRTADAARLSTVDPTGDHGLLLEVVTATGALAVTLSPQVVGYNGDTPKASALYVAITNRHTGASAIDVDFNTKGLT